MFNRIWSSIKSSAGFYSAVLSDGWSSASLCSAVLSDSCLVLAYVQQYCQTAGLKLACVQYCQTAGQCWLVFSSRALCYISLAYHTDFGMIKLYLLPDVTHFQT